MTCGFAIRPSAKSTATTTYRPAFGLAAYHVYAPSASRKNVMLNTVFRSAIQTTDSTLIGCTANRRRDHQAAACISSRTEQDEKQNHRIKGVQNDAGLVMTGGGHVIELEVERMGKPSDRMPIAGVIGDECPVNRVPREAVLHMLVVGDIDIVVVINEAVGASRIVYREAQNEENESKDAVAKRAGGEWPVRTRLHLLIRLQADRTHGAPFEGRVYPIESGPRRHAQRSNRALGPGNEVPLAGVHCCVCRHTHVEPNGVISRGRPLRREG